MELQPYDRLLFVMAHSDEDHCSGSFEFIGLKTRVQQHVGPRKAILNDVPSCDLSRSLGLTGLGCDVLDFWVVLVSSILTVLPQKLIHPAQYT